MPPRVALIVLAASLALPAFACGGGSSGDDETPSPAATAVETPATSPAVDRGRIRALDLAAVPAVAALLARAGGSFDRAAVQFGDVTGDGVEEAVVPVSSDGTQGASAFVVLTPAGGSARSLLEVAAGSRGGVGTRIEDGSVVAVEPVYGPDDPECCPGSLRRSIYTWDGEALALASQTTEPAPGGGIKGTPGAE
jgi:hypothetical protein